MRTKISLFILLVFIVGVVFIIARPADKTSNKNTNTFETQNLSTVPASMSTTTSVATYSLIDVAKHSGISSCWSMVNGSVYDLTSWIDKHPGGSKAIIGICGKDGSAVFDAKHGGQRRPADELKGFLIGNLAK